MKRLALLTTALMLTACNGGPNKTNIELIQGMMDQVSIKAQDWDQHDDKLQMRQPPEGTVPQGFTPYAHKGDPAAAEKDENPHAGDMSADFLTEGHKQYDIYCAVCHGKTGHGDGPVSVKMPIKPRNLMSEEALAYSDGRIYFAVTAGKGVMSSYATQITSADKRWAVVNYVRSMQKTAK